MGGRVKDPEQKRMVAKNIGDIGGATMMDLESGAFKPKKAKKEKSPNAVAVADLKGFEKKNLVSSLDFPRLSIVCLLQRVLVLWLPLSPEKKSIHNHGLWYLATCLKFSTPESL